MVFNGYMIAKGKQFFDYRVILVFCFIVSVGLFIAYRQTVVKNRYLVSIFPILHRYQKPPKQVINDLHWQGALPDIIEHGSREKPLVALTFDADMTYQMLDMLNGGKIPSLFNSAIMNTLHKEHVKATVFLTGLWVKAYPVESKALARDPLIELGNHSYSHPAFTDNCYQLPSIPDSEAADQVDKAQVTIQNVTGIIPKYFRFPGGCFDKTDLETVLRLGLKVVHWDVVAEDVFNYDTASIIYNVLSKTQNGSIIVMHFHGGPFAPKTNDALVKIIPELKRRGFTFVTVTELLDAMRTSSTPQ